MKGKARPVDEEQRAAVQDVQVGDLCAMLAQPRCETAQAHPHPNDHRRRPLLRLVLVRTTMSFKLALMVTGKGTPGVQYSCKLRLRFTLSSQSSVLKMPLWDANSRQHASSSAAQ